MRNNKKKKFDCVEMKRKGAEIVYKKIKNMTLDEELKYWDMKTKELKKIQLKIINNNKKTA